ncbi:MAG TPA: hypothetical protein VF616_29250, partial [Duganella sp.]|uniref:hypothetical protein n=1 Tax=Duganella sp. TaxID=1904440 RepID=UPI002ECFB3DE
SGVTLASAGDVPQMAADSAPTQPQADSPAPGGAFGGSGMTGSDSGPTPQATKPEPGGKTPYSPGKGK